MSLLSTFLAKHLIPSLELAFIAHAPDMQKLLIDESVVLAKNIVDWVESKRNPADDEEE
jgi:hypothetical protein